jgi:hypothetical protein
MNFLHLISYDLTFLQPSEASSMLNTLKLHSQRTSRHHSTPSAALITPTPPYFFFFIAIMTR